MSKKELNVSALENGTVIDHIPAKSLFKVIDILGLAKVKTMITFGTNLDSKHQGKKGIIKISEYFFKDNEVNRIALAAPQAKLNTIKNYQVTDKKVVEVPDEIHGTVKCMNPACVTNHQRIKTRFYVVDKKEVHLRCHYCEKITDQENLKFLKEE